MRRLSEHISHRLILIFFFAIALFGIASYFLCRAIEINQYEKLLETTLKTVALSLKNPEDFQRYANRFSDATNMRITIVDSDGTPLADSEANPQTMDNHLNRSEIIDAQKDAFGFALRRSDTLNAELLYAAQKIAIDGKTYFIRVNTTLENIIHSFLQVWISITIIYAIAVLILIVWISGLNRSVRSEVIKIYSAFKALDNKEYSVDFGFGFAKEFYEIGLYLKQFAKKLQKRDKQKRKYAAKLKLADRQKSAIISAIAHEFKNPIAAVIGYAQTVSEDSDLPIEIRQSFCEKIVKNSQKISDLIDRLSLSIKLESNEIKLNKTDFMLNPVLRDLIANFASQFPKREIIYDSEPTIAYGDKQMLEAAVANLIQNALKYSKKEIKISLKNGVLSVQDFGIGIAEDEIPKIVNKFYRVSSESWDNSLGLGLFFVGEVLRLHDSKLEIKSELNVGSIFSFKAPKQYNPTEINEI